jgi:hypothetical protein
MLLFLDFDGVLHPTDGEKFNQKCLNILESVLVEYPEIMIVISSSWREFMDLTQMREHLGEVIGEKVVGITPIISQSHQKHIRYQEVLKYLNDEGSDHAWVALDDETYCYPEHAPVVWCNGSTGMSGYEEAQLRAVLRILEYHYPSKSYGLYKLSTYSEEELLKGMTPEKAHADELEQ